MQNVRNYIISVEEELEKAIYHSDGNVARLRKIKIDNLKKDTNLLAEAYDSGDGHDFLVRMNHFLDEGIMENLRLDLPEATKSAIKKLFHEVKGYNVGHHSPLSGYMNKKIDVYSQMIDLQDWVKMIPREVLAVEKDFDYVFGQIMENHSNPDYKRVAESLRKLNQHYNSEKMSKLIDKL